MTEAAIAERLERLQTTVETLCALIGTRLTRSEVLTRLRVSEKTLRERVRRGEYPSPGKDGKWLLSEIVEWESRH